MDGHDERRHRGERESANEIRRQRFYDSRGYSRGRERRLSREDSRRRDRRDSESGSGRAANDDAEWRGRGHRGSSWAGSASVSALHRHVEEVSARLRREVQSLHRSELSSAPDAPDEVAREKSKWRRDEAELLRTRRLIDQDLAVLPTAHTTPTAAAGVTAASSEGAAASEPHTGMRGPRGVAIAAGAGVEGDAGDRDEGIAGGLQIGSVKEGQQIAKALLAGPLCPAPFLSPLSSPTLPRLCVPSTLP